MVSFCLHPQDRNISIMSTKHKHLSFETKIKAIEAVEQGRPKKIVAFDFSIPPSTLSTWLKNREQIQEGYDKQNPARKRQRTGQYKDVDEALIKWIEAARADSIPLSGPMLMSKACDFAEKLGIHGFKTSNGWFDRFKRRHNLSFHTVCGESPTLSLSGSLRHCRTSSPSLKQKIFLMQTRLGFSTDSFLTRHGPSKETLQWD